MLEMGFNSLYRREDVGQNIVEFVGIFKIFAAQDEFLERYHLTGYSPVLTIVRLALLS